MDTERAANHDAAVWDSHPTKWPSLCPQREARSTVIETRWEEMKTENWMFLLWLKQNRHEGPLATRAKEDNLHRLTNATYRCVLETERVLTDSDWTQRKAGRQRPGSTSPTDTVHTVCSHIRHNPAKSCHCEPPLNESASIRRLSKVRCDKKPQWGIKLFELLVYQLKLEFDEFQKYAFGKKSDFVKLVHLNLQTVSTACLFAFEAFRRLSVCALCVCPENSVLHITRFCVWLPLIPFVVGFKQICRLHVLLFY